MKRTDINRFNTTTQPVTAEHEKAVCAGGAIKSVLRMLGRMLWTFVLVMMIGGTITLISVIAFLFQLKSQTTTVKLESYALDYSSMVYTENEEGETVKYLTLYSTEDRVWKDWDEIPEYMKDAMVAIEDKRFYDHDGVDWYTTFGAVLKLFTGQSGGGGSTITQQLVKNITGKNEVSLLRKAKEIFSALQLEENYTKEEILEAYLNVVNFGGNCSGVEAAAQLYFGKSITECDLAECACIAGITQNPYKYNPLYFPEQNKERQQIVLQEMYEQGKVTRSEYEEAMAKSENMTFVGYAGQEDDDDETLSAIDTWDWYTEAMFKDVVRDLQEVYDITEEKAIEMIYHEGLSIYSAMDMQDQKIAEEVFADESLYATDAGVQTGFYMMDYTGRTLCIIGARGEKRATGFGVMRPIPSGSPVLRLSLLAFMPLLWSRV